ncbi:hypothetical protein KXD40_004190 [Peronospora effusa]|uniref:Uncharacterized protein n=1 Tax=Peronospora effusa TaxID=542832 RepID=A0A3M6VHW5_9STRA|nr:hypothetical protein DD238_005260 [Peronospora effusa]RQM18573.1 hypothetical protein DD237_001681 [Peronospora effusa]UIZ28315.1 hypothetical protein KXD40_004190 [Peronospora effusa]
MFLRLGIQSTKGNYEVAFCHKLGDEMVFHQLLECTHARCNEVTAFFAEFALDPWPDASQELKGRHYAICDVEAAQLI